MNKEAEGTHIAIFNEKKIRRKLINNEWFFSVVDVVWALTDSVDAKDYWYRLKQREKEGSEIELSTFCRQLKMLPFKVYFTLNTSQTQKPLT